MSNEKVYGMRFSKIYPLLVNKAEKKGRTLEEVKQVIVWLTGYTEEEIEQAAESPLTYGDFFRNAPHLNPNRKQITGVVCGVRVEEIQEPLMQEIRYLDKLIDELAKGKAMGKILRSQVQTSVEAINPNGKTYRFDAVIEPVPEKGGAYVRFPYDIRKEFGKGRVKAEITFDGEPYSGSIVNMGVKHEDGSICYIIGIRKDIQTKIGKQPGDTVNVTVKAIQPQEMRQAMWECPKCGRKFKNTNQNHYCGAAPQNIEEYIAQQPQHTQPYLQQINNAIQNILPEAKQKISWSMPTYWKKRNLIQFAAFKNHIGLYPGPAAVEAFADRLQDYKTSKGTIQLPYNKPLPLDLIGEIAAWCGKEYGE